MRHNPEAAEILRVIVSPTWRPKLQLWLLQSSRIQMTPPLLPPHGPGCCCCQGPCCPLLHQHWFWYWHWCYGHFSTFLYFSSQLLCVLQPHTKHSHFCSLQKEAEQRTMHSSRMLYDCFEKIFTHEYVCSSPTFHWFLFLWRDERMLLYGQNDSSNFICQSGGGLGFSPSQIVTLQSHCVVIPLSEQPQYSAKRNKKLLYTMGTAWQSASSQMMESLCHWVEC